MTLLFGVEYLEGPGQGLVHLHRAPSGPAGEARLKLAEGLTCWFDPTEPSTLTDCWVDLEVVDDQWLAHTLGTEALGLRDPGGIAQLGTGGEEQAWLGPAWRLAVLEQIRSTPLGAERPVPWALEAIVLRDSLDRAGLSLTSWLEPELAIVLPALERLGAGAVPAGSMVEHAVHVLLDRLDILHPALDRLDHLVKGPVGRPGQLDVLLADLRISAVAPEPTYLSEIELSAHDQLWSHLPDDLFPAGLFASMAFVARTLDGLRPRLRISMQRPSRAAILDRPLFVRLVDPSVEVPSILAVDALIAEDGWYVTTMDIPPGFDQDRTRIEIVCRLDLPLLSSRDHARARGRQWSVLALSAERTGRQADAVRYWRLSEVMHRSAGADDLADAAGAQARRLPDREPGPPFLAESAQGEGLDNPDPDPGPTS